MNEKVIAVICLVLVLAGQPLVLALSPTNDRAPMTWHIETVDSAGTVGAFASIALDTINRPHISYRDFTNKDLKYARWTGSAWSIQIVDSARDVGEYTSIALDSGDKPHISYRDWTYYDLKYARWTGSAWSIETVDSAGSVGFYTSLALDSGDKPHISYRDLTNEALKYARWTGSAWSIQTVDSAGNVGWGTSIALDSGDKPHISYQDFTNEDLKYARWTGSTWSIETVDSAGDVGITTSIALDSGDNPHISYGANGDLKYARWTGSAWSIQTVDSAGQVGKYSSIALDSGYKPHISYNDRTNLDLKYARWTGSAWSIETVDSAGDVGITTSIALDSGDNPHISYHIGDPIRDLKYARPSEPIIHLESRQDTGATYNLGRIRFDGTYYSLPKDIIKPGYTYAIDYQEPAGYAFVRWVTSGGVSVLSPTVKSTTVKVTGTGTLRAVYKATIPAFQYHFQAKPYSNVFHVNVDKNGWINGYITGGPTGWNPVLGKIVGDRFCMAIDVNPDGSPGWYEMLFHVARVSTMTGQFIRTTDGMSFYGPNNVNYVFLSGSEEAGGVDMMEVTDAGVAPDAWYRFRLSPYTDIININGNPGGWLNGYDEPDHPVLGFTEGGRFYFGIDGLDTPYTLVFNTGSLSTLTGQMIRTQDGNAFDGPNSIWITWVSSEGEPVEGEQALMN